MIQTVDNPDQPFLKQQMFDSSKPKEFADNNFEVDENSRMFSKWVENNVVKKRELARYE